MLLARNQWRARSIGVAGLIVIGMALLFGMTYGKAFAAFSGEGGGSAASPYIVRTADQLNEVRNNLTAHYRLEANIDLAAAGYTNWNPIGSWGGPTSGFSGVFDGNGYTIAGLKAEGTANHVGWFGFTSGAVIRNVGLIDVRVEGVDYVGGVVGYAQNTIIENSYVTGKVAGDRNVGGIAGYISSSNFNPSRISNAYAAVTVTGTSEVGGLIGKSEGPTSVDNAYYDNSLTAGSAGGTGMSTAQLKQKNTYGEAWNFSPGEAWHWGMLDNVSYPMHRRSFDSLLLGELAVTNGIEPIALEPVFAGEQYHYSLRVRGDIDSLTVAGTPARAAALVSVKGGGDVEAVVLTPGPNAIHVEVSHTGLALPGVTTDPVTVTYTVTIVRENGSVDYPHTIETTEQLAAIGTGDFELSDHYQLVNDLDLSAVANWSPIGSGAAPFSGYFDGGHHVVYNMNALWSGEDNVGLFGSNQGTIVNLGLEKVDVAGGSYVGALVGRNLAPDGQLSNVYATGSVSGDDKVGGLVGRNEHLVSEAYYTGTVDSAGTAGGLIGEQGEDASVTDAYWDTTVSNLTVSTGGTGKSTADMQNQATYSSWDFTNTWGMLNGSSYPGWLRVVDSVKLSSLTVTPAAGTASWSQVFAPGQGAYTLTLDRYTSEATIAAASSEVGVSVTIDGAPGTSSLVSVHIGNNLVPIRVQGADGLAEGVYLVRLVVPAPAMTHVAVPDADVYGVGAMLTFVIAYEDEVQVAGTPRLPLTIGAEAVYAEYAGQPSGEPNKLIFQYAAASGLLDSDGIELGPAIDLPPGADITASGHAVTLAVAADVSGIRVDGVEPVVIGATDGEIYNTARTITYDEGTATLNGEPFASGTTVDDEGEHTLIVTDEAGNATSVAFVLDKTAPVVTGVADGGSYSAGQVIHYNEGTATLNGEPFSSGDTVGEAGEHTLIVTDAAGNHVAVNFRIYVPVPSVPSVSVSKPMIDLNGRLLDPDSIDTSKPSVVLEITPQGRVVRVGIPEAVMSALYKKNNGFIIEIKTPYGSYRVPVGLASLIEGLEPWLDENRLKAEDVLFRISLTDQSEDTDILSALKNSLPRARVLGAIVDFHIDIVNKHTGAVIGSPNAFTKPLTRIIPMPDATVAMPAYWGTFRYDDMTGTFGFVPSRTERVDGVWYVLMESYSNSAYVVAEHRAGFTDASNHWGASYINLAAAKGLVEGTGGGRFAPDNTVTRAEFAAMLIRAIGRGTTAAIEPPYADVQPSAWYYDEVAAAKELGLLKFVQGKAFAPNRPLTREEMASMMAAAVRLVGLPSVKQEANLQHYADYERIGEAYREDVRLMTQLNIMNGTSEEKFSPKENTTRAQAAAVFIRMLQALGWID